MLPLCFTKFLDHRLDLASDGLVSEIGRRLLVNQIGFHQRLVPLRERTRRSDQVAVRQVSVGAGALGQREAKPENELLPPVEKLFIYLNLGEKGRRIDVIGQLILRFRVGARLLKIRTVTRAIERHFPLLATALRADFPMHSRTKPLFLSLFTNRATHVRRLTFDYFTEKPVPPPSRQDCTKSLCNGLGLKVASTFFVRGAFAAEGGRSESLDSPISSAPAV